MVSKIHIYHRDKFTKLQDSRSFGVIPDGAVLVEGFLSKSEDVTSSNGYRYEPDFWGQVTSRKEFKDRLKAREMLGCIEHPKDDEDYLYTPYNKAALIVLDVTMKGTDPYGIIGLLNNDEGTYLKSIVEFGSRIGVSTRGVGATKFKDGVTVVDPVGYSVITWDSVCNPNLPVTLGIISDSMMKSQRFIEMFGAVKLRDSGSTDFNRSNLDADIKKMHDEAQAYLMASRGVKKALLGDGSLLVRAKREYDKFISDGGTNEMLMLKKDSYPLAYAYLRSLIG
jgi:hypothetical protein